MSHFTGWLFDWCWFGAWLASGWLASWFVCWVDWGWLAGCMVEKVS